METQEKQEDVEGFLFMLQVNKSFHLGLQKAELTAFRFYKGLCKFEVLAELESAQDF
ncbi:hypothetical protein J3P75_11020 [Pseudomonas sp. R1-1]|uniref:hypothetical protein n=1 Tax=Pseudomonas sp. R1-1 TaxID=1602529 RepID=UPI003DA99C43